ncbi:MAG: zinc-dependent alcohol dehydrogenase family protein [Thiogranum sp.]|nr:zinc-dependent alcohol dehydrogenase family protein [Thiogranum sp.]
MRAIQMTEIGAPEVLKLVEVPQPEPQAGEVLVHLHAAGVNPVDAKLRSRGLLFPDALPAIPGCDGAGTITAVGTGVDRLAPGDAVWFCNGGLGREPGNYAEYSAVSANVARLKPAALSFEQAAAAPLVLITAWEALFDRANLQPGQRVLIHGGAGGVGHVAIQLARHAGAQVCTTVGSAEHARFATSLGADCVINHHEQNLIDAVHDWSAGKGVDIALDIMGGLVFQESMKAMAHYGTLVTLLDPGPDIDWTEARNRNLRVGFELMLTPMLFDLPEARAHHGEILDRCAELADQGKLRIDVGKSYPLAEAAAAHRQIESGHTGGKLVLVP